jgi:hypothetical protein
MSWGNLLGLSVSEKILKVDLDKQIKKQFISWKHDLDKEQGSKTVIG